jgi:YVTN family beta-propeller protein
VSVGNFPSFTGQFIGPVHVTPVLPVANFITNVSEGYAPLDVQFTDLSQNANSWAWDFGDGATSIVRNPTHIYSVAGSYTVNLTVGNGSYTNSKTAIITITQEPPIANVGPYAYITNTHSNTISIINTTTNKIIATVNVGEWPYGVAVSPDGSRVYVVNAQLKHLSIFLLATARIDESCPSATPTRKCLNSDGTSVSGPLDVNRFTYALFEPGFHFLCYFGWACVK